MAATGPDRRAFLIGLGGLLAVQCATAAPRDVRGTITYVGSALANGNPADAMTVFAKTCPGYEKLVDYFSTLTASYEVESVVEISDEDTKDAESEVQATWTLTLASRAGDTTTRRSKAVVIRLSKNVGKDWKISSFSPIDLFDPQTASY